MWDCHECHTLSHSSQICINYQFDWLGHGMKPEKQIKLQNPIVLYLFSCKIPQFKLYRLCGKTDYPPEDVM